MSTTFHQLSNTLFLIICIVFAGTDTTETLDYIANNIFGPNGSFGDRTENENLIVFFTDGVSTDGVNGYNVATEAPKVHAVADIVSFCKINFRSRYSES